MKQLANKSRIVTMHHLKITGSALALQFHGAKRIYSVPSTNPTVLEYNGCSRRIDCFMKKEFFLRGTNLNIFLKSFPFTFCLSFEQVVSLFSLFPFSYTYRFEFLHILPFDSNVPLFAIVTEKLIHFIRHNHLLLSLEITFTYIFTCFFGSRSMSNVLTTKSRSHSVENKGNKTVSRILFFMVMITNQASDCKEEARIDGSHVFEECKRCLAAKGWSTVGSITNQASPGS